MREEKIKDGTGVHSKTTSKQDETSAFSPRCQSPDTSQSGSWRWLPARPSCNCLQITRLISLLHKPLAPEAGALHRLVRWNIRESRQHKASQKQERETERKRARERERIVINCPLCAPNTGWLLLLMALYQAVLHEQASRQIKPPLGPPGKLKRGKTVYQTMDSFQAPLDQLIPRDRMKETANITCSAGGFQPAVSCSGSR